MAEGIHLPTAAGTLVGLAGAMHVAVGVDALATEITLLPTLLVLWGTVAILGVVATTAGVLPRRFAYPGGVVWLLLALVGYVDVYGLGVGESVIGVELQPPETTHEHGAGTGVVHQHGSPASSDASFLDRLAAGHFALPSKIVELGALALLLVLHGRD